MIRVYECSNMSLCIHLPSQRDDLAEEVRCDFLYTVSLS